MWPILSHSLSVSSPTFGLISSAYIWVERMELCPKTFCRVSSGIPLRMAKTANVWRPICGVTSVRQSHFLPMILRLRNIVLYSPTGKTQSGESFFSSTPLYFSISSIAIGNNFTTYATPVFIRFPISHVPPSESVWILS